MRARNSIILQGGALVLAAIAAVLNYYSGNGSNYLFCIQISCAALVVAVWSGGLAMRAIELGEGSRWTWAVFICAVLEVNLFLFCLYAAEWREGELPRVLHILVVSALPVLIPVMTLAGCGTWAAYALFKRRLHERYSDAARARLIAAAFTLNLIVLLPVPMFLYCAIPPHHGKYNGDWRDTVAEGMPNFVRDRGVEVTARFLDDGQQGYLNLMLKYAYCSESEMLKRLRLNGPDSYDAFEALAEKHPDRALEFALDVGDGFEKSDWTMGAGGLIGKHGSASTVRRYLSQCNDEQFLQGILLGIKTDWRVCFLPDVHQFVRDRANISEGLVDILFDVESRLNLTTVKSEPFIQFCVEEAKSPTLRHIAFMTQTISQRRRSFYALYESGKLNVIYELCDSTAPNSDIDSDEGRRVWIMWLQNRLYDSELQMRRVASFEIARVLDLDLVSTPVPSDFAATQPPETEHEALERHALSAAASAWENRQMMAEAKTHTPQIPSPSNFPQDAAPDSR